MPTEFRVRINGGKERPIKIASKYRFRAAACAAFAFISDNEIERGKVRIEVMCPKLPGQWFAYLIRFDDQSRMIINTAEQK